MEPQNLLGPFGFVWPQFGPFCYGPENRGWYQQTVWVEVFSTTLLNRLNREIADIEAQLAAQGWLSVHRFTLGWKLLQLRRARRKMEGTALFLIDMVWREVRDAFDDLMYFREAGDFGQMLQAIDAVREALRNVEWG
ncbi:unnamed protein product, partial [Prunus brigantina]